MKKNIKISVIIPLFNKEKTIYRTVQSVLDQTFPQFELLIIDDGSTDDSFNIISNIKDERICIYTKENSGVSDSRNFGIKKACGDYLFLLDADDLIKKECLETLYKLTVLYPNESVFCGDFETINSNATVSSSSCQLDTQTLITEPLKELWRDGVFLRTGNMLVKEQCFDVVGGFDTRLSYYEDMDHVLNLIRKFNVVFDPKVIFSYQLEHNHLSSIKVPLSKDWSFYASFENKSYYEKLIIGSVVYRVLRKRLRGKDYFRCFSILNKHVFYLHYILGSRALHVIDRLKKKYM
jgi:glycosyltransferase involved in cell wall biosynthesis